MIVEWFVSLASGFVGWLATLFPVLDLPPELVNADEGFNQVMALGDGLGAFVNWTVVGILAGIPITIWIGGLLLRAARVGLSHIPFFGGRG